MELFYSTSIVEDHFILDGEEAQHLIRVLRHREGDTIMITDGKNHLYTTELVDGNPKKCSLKIISKENKEYENKYSLHIGIAPTKNSDRLEWFLEKSTEIGITEISTVICQHSERRIVKDERLNKVLIAAMKQSLKSFLPVLHPLKKFEDFLKDCREPQRFICTMDAGESLFTRYKHNENTVLLIGPEGDFSKEEIILASKHGFVPVSLGNSRLRTETAGVMACATLALAQLNK